MRMNYIKDKLLKVAVMFYSIREAFAEMRRFASETMVVIGNSPFSWFVLPIIIGVTLSIVLGITYILLEAWVLSILWSWFITPAFSFAPSFMFFCGVVLSSKVLHTVKAKMSDITMAQTAAGIAIRLIRPFAILSLAWLVHTFVGM